MKLVGSKDGFVTTVNAVITKVEQTWLVAEVELSGKAAEVFVVALQSSWGVEKGCKYEMTMFWKVHKTDAWWVLTDIKLLERSEALQNQDQEPRTETRDD